MQHLLVILLAAVLCADLAAAQIRPVQRTETGVVEDYLIQPGDSLDISVLEDPGLNRQVLVQPDGRISLPLAGVLDATDRTPEMLAREIVRRLSQDFVTPPTVTVALVNLGAVEEDLVSIYIIGAVPNPGRFDVEPPVDILQALAIAGGPGVFAARQRIQIRRQEGGEDTVVLFNYDTIETGSVPAGIVALRDRDVVVVPERGLFE